MPLLPVALYGLEVPCGDILVAAVPDFPATFRITMAAIDPDEEPNMDNGSTIPRATLKLLRQPIGPSDEDSEEDSDDEAYMRALLAGPDSDEESEDDEEDEEANGGPSDPAKSKKARKQAALQQLLASIDKDDSDDDMEDAPNGANGVKKASKKGKSKAIAEDDDEEDEDEDLDSDEEDLDIEEFVLCTLDPQKNYQQTLDITVGEDERVFFKVSGTHTIYLTGNYVVPDDHGHNHHHEVYDSDDDEEEDEDYDLSPDEDELELEMEDDESDDLDNLADPRITEVDSEEEVVPKLVTKAEKKGKNKRAAEELEEGSTLDDLMAKSLKPEPATNGEPQLSKKQLKKLKKNSGDAVGTKTDDAKSESASKESPASAKSDKKVQFAKNLEQGPTGSAAEKKDASKKDGPKELSSKDGKPKATLGVKTVNGVKIDDKKLGSGPAAKNGDKVGMRYIGKLVDGKVFDSNKKGKAFQFKLGAGEVIKGWDIGVLGMSVGGERRLTIPANLAYGSSKNPGIPANSTLVFDVKLLEIK